MPSNHAYRQSLQQQALHPSRGPYRVWQPPPTEHFDSDDDFRPPRERLSDSPPNTSRKQDDRSTRASQDRTVPALTDMMPARPPSRNRDKGTLSLQEDPSQARRGLFSFGRKGTISRSSSVMPPSGRVTPITSVELKEKSSETRRYHSLDIDPSSRSRTKEASKPQTPGLLTKVLHPLQRRRESSSTTSRQHRESPSSVADAAKLSKTNLNSGATGRESRRTSQQHMTNSSSLAASESLAHSPSESKYRDRTAKASDNSSQLRSSPVPRGSTDTLETPSLLSERNGRSKRGGSFWQSLNFGIRGRKDRESTSSISTNQSLSTLKSVDSRLAAIGAVIKPHPPLASSSVAMPSKLREERTSFSQSYSHRSSMEENVNTRIHEPSLPTVTESKKSEPPRPSSKDSAPRIVEAPSAASKSIKGRPTNPETPAPSKPNPSSAPRSHFTSASQAVRGESDSSFATALSEQSDHRDNPHTSVWKPAPVSNPMRVRTASQSSARSATANATANTSAWYSRSDHLTASPRNDESTSSGRSNLSEAKRGSARLPSTPLPASPQAALRTDAGSKLSEVRPGFKATSASSSSGSSSLSQRVNVTPLPSTPVYLRVGTTEIIAITAPIDSPRVNQGIRREVRTSTVESTFIDYPSSSDESSRWHKSNHPYTAVSTRPIREPAQPASKSMKNKEVEIIRPRQVNPPVPSTSPASASKGPAPLKYGAEETYSPMLRSTASRSHSYQAVAVSPATLSKTPSDLDLREAVDEHLSALTQLISKAEESSVMKPGHKVQKQTTETAELVPYEAPVRQGVVTAVVAASTTANPRVRLVESLIEDGSSKEVDISDKPKKSGTAEPSPLTSLSDLSGATRSPFPLSLWKPQFIELYHPSTPTKTIARKSPFTVVHKEDEPAAPSQALTIQTSTLNQGYKLISRKNRSLSLASMDALDGADSIAASSIRSPTPGTPQLSSPPRRDPMLAAADWIEKEEEKFKESERTKRHRPGVTWDDIDTPTEYSPSITSSNWGLAY